MENENLAECAICYHKLLKIDAAREEELYYHISCYQTYQLKRIANELILLRLMLKERK